MDKKVKMYSFEGVTFRLVSDLDEKFKPLDTEVWITSYDSNTGVFSECFIATIAGDTIEEFFHDFKELIKKYKI